MCEVKEKKGFKILGEILDTVEIFIFVFFILMILTRIFLFWETTVVGRSMEPTLHGGDKLILMHMNYTPKKNDIVVINCQGLKKCIIKRCIATEGDDVKINYKDQTVKVNDEIIDEPYINKEPMNNSFLFDQSYATEPNEYEYHVPEGKIFVMGDNRNNSSDSRQSEVGFIDEKDVLGKATLRMAPFDSFGFLK